MNRIYRTLWNAALGRMVVASELARAPSGRRRVALLASVALALPMTAMAQATAVGLQTFEAPAAVDATDVARYFQASGSADSDAGAYVEGDNALAAGEAASAIGNGATALGGGAVAVADDATAVGKDSLATGNSATAVGGMLRLDYSDIGSFGVVLDQQTSASGLAATALGAGAQANGDFNTAIGAQTETSGKSAVAIGGIADVLEDQLGEGFAGSDLQNTRASGRLSTAIGGGAQALEYASTAIGALANASGIRSIAIGYVTQANGYDATAVGDRADAAYDWATAIGAGARAMAVSANALGSFSSAWGENSTAVGWGAFASGVNATGLGSGSWAAGRNSIAIGKATVWNGYFWGEGDPILYVDSIAMGTDANVYGSNSIAMGTNALVGREGDDGLWGPVDNSVALGANSFADRDNTISVGSAGAERQITHVAAGTEDTDAVNLAQLKAAAGASTRYFQASGSADSDAGAYVEGDEAVAAGEAAAAIGDGTVALGGGAVAVANEATAIGKDSLSTGNSATAVGGMLRLDYSEIGSYGVVLDQQTVATGLASTALGAGAQANGDFNTAIGAQTETSGKSAVAIGGIVDVLEDQIGEGFAGSDLQNTRASGRLSTAIGGGAQALEYASTAIGALANASGIRSIAIGYVTQANGYDATAVGDRADAAYDWATAIGAGARAMAVSANALGSFSSAWGENSTAVGWGAFASGINATGLGSGSWAAGRNSIAIGKATVWNGYFWGEGDPILYVDSIAMGTDAEVHGSRSVAIGPNAFVGIQEDSGLWAPIDGSVALGAGSLADRANTISVGRAGAERQITNVAAGTQDTDAVNLAQVRSMTSGLGELAENAVVYDDAEKASLRLAGADGTRIGNLADGAVSASSTDAINGRQLHAGLQSAADALGGGATVTAIGTLSAPSYAIQGSGYVGIAATFAALDTQITRLNQRVDRVETVVEQGGANDRVAVGGDAPATVGVDTNAVAVGAGAAANGDNGVALGGNAYAHGPNDTAIGGNARVNADGSTAVGANASISANATNAVAVGESASVTAASGTAIGQGASVTAQGAVALGQGAVADRANTVSVGNATQQRQITNVAAGTQTTDAANVGQVRAGVTEAKAYADTTATQAVATSKAYTDQRLASWGDQFEVYRGDVERRFSDTERRIDKQGAMSAAMLNMATNAAGTQSPRGRVAVGAGFQSGEQALSIGYAKKVGERASFSLGGAFSGDEKSAGIGFGIDL
ncbi:ESPR-type extended signal peptide-containing protein [Luteimonas sp. SMYT11W]|uniref:ESPR-type extended signal peptide-containing protein n=1 Tax=Luteimonas flava TaxID=3115822 RepID=A0ABU7WDF5_9GAMM